MAELRELQAKAARLRRLILEMDYHTGGGHIGGALGASDVLTALYFDVMNQSPAQFAAGDPDRDRFILSKGHVSDAFYAVLAMAGYLPEAELASYIQHNSRLGGHPTNHVPGVELNTGSLGHGLPVAAGMAKGLKMSGSPARVFVLTGDGELAEGSNWEGAMAAAHYRLDNLTWIIDRNRLQIGGCTEDVMSLEPLADKCRAFGFELVEIDGNDMAAVLAALRAPNTSGKPRCILSNSTKGKGVSYMENVAKWHHGTPNDEQYLQAVEELNAQITANGGEPIPAQLKAPKAKSAASYIPARKAVTDMLTERANTDERIVALTSDARGSASLDSFLTAHPERFVEVGIAEQNEVGMAAGLSLTGKIPFACAPASFLTARCYDQVKADMAYSQTNVKLLGVSGGASYESLGQTHHSTNDIAAMRALPGMTVVIPADAASARALAEQALEMYGPVYIRVGRAATPDVYTEEALGTIRLGKASCLREGRDGVILSCGVLGLNAMAAAEELAKQGKDVAVWDFHTVAPLDEETIRALAKQYGRLLTVEEHVRSGGFGSAVCVAVSELGVPVKVMAFPDENAPVGTASEIYADFGLDAASIAKEAAAWLDR